MIEITPVTAEQMEALTRQPIILSNVVFVMTLGADGEWIDVIPDPLPPPWVKQDGTPA